MLDLDVILLLLQFVQWFSRLKPLLTRLWLHCGRLGLRALLGGGRNASQFEAKATA